MKTIRVEVFEDSERILVDGEEVKDITFEVAFLDGPASVTVGDFVRRVQRPVEPGVPAGVLAKAEPEVPAKEA